MGVTLTYILFYIQCLLISIGLIYSIATLRRVKLDKIKFFLLYYIVCFIVMVPILLFYSGILFFNFSEKLNNATVIFSFCFFYFVIRSEIWDKKKANFLDVFFLILIIIIIYFITKNFDNKPNYIAFSFNYLGLIIFCSVYFIKLLDKDEFNPLVNPFFWIITGIFICSSFSFFVTLSLGKYFDFNYGIRSNVFTRNIPVVANIIMQLSFIRGIKCSTLK
jgi:hypothetical protein